MVLCPRPHREGKQCRAMRPKYPAYGLKLSQPASQPFSVGPFGYACALLYASEHVKQRTQGTEPTGR
jgi:hypothetical protein